MKARLSWEREITQCANPLSIAPSSATLIYVLTRPVTFAVQGLTSTQTQTQVRRQGYPLRAADLVHTTVGGPLALAYTALTHRSADPI